MDCVCVMVHLSLIKSSTMNQICLPGGNVLKCITFIQRFWVFYFKPSFAKLET